MMSDSVMGAGAGGGGGGLLAAVDGAKSASSMNSAANTPSKAPHAGSTKINKMIHSELLSSLHNSSSVSNCSFKSSENAGKPDKKKKMKRVKKCGYNVYSREFRKKLRDENSTLTFVEMSREVGNHWRLLSDKERAVYEDMAKEESSKEEAALAEAQKLQALKNPQNAPVVLAQHSNGAHINQILASQSCNLVASKPQHIQPQNIINVTPANAVQLNLNYGINAANSTATYILKPSGHQQIQLSDAGGASIQLNGLIQNQQQQQHHHQQQQQHQTQQIVHQVQLVEQTQNNGAKSPFVQYQTKSFRSQHHDAYVKYVDNLRKNPEQRTTFISDWQKSLDTRFTSLKEANMKPVPSCWIENTQTTDVLKHLASLRYYLLNDAINIHRYEFGDVTNNEDLETEITNVSFG
jgi:hypothetical protein